jgi:amino-acid N-acetyltransferase
MIEISKPLLSDIQEMYDLVSNEVESGNILYRSIDEIATTIRSYIIAKDRDKIVGFLALHIHTISLAEIRSMIVKDEFRRRGIATKLISEAIKEAKLYGVRQLLVLTYQESFFLNLGFGVIDKESLPENKIWTDCIKCKHFPVCNEVSLVKDI